MLSQNSNYILSLQHHKITGIEFVIYHFGYDAPLNSVSFL